MLRDDDSAIKLLIITPSLLCGGAEKYVSLLCNNISTEKFSVTLLVLDNQNPFYTITNSNVKLVDLKVKQVRNSLFKIRAMVKQLQPDILFSTANHLNIYLAASRRFFSKKIIFIARESSLVSSNSKRAKFPFLYNGLIKKFYRRLDFIICQSVYMQQDLIDHYNIKKENTIVINNAVEENIAALADEINFQPHKFITVARLSAEKGIDRLIRSVAKLNAPFIYYIIGDGDKKRELQNLIEQLGLQQKVFLTGNKENPFAGHADAHLFLMGSHYEGFPNTLLEAGAMGIPVIAFTAPGGISEIITQGQNGFLVNNGDENEFAAAVEKAMGINFNRQLIKSVTLQKYSLNPLIKKTEAVFVHLLQGVLPNQ